MNQHQALPFTRDYLTDGYISYTFGPQNAEDYVPHLFNVDTTAIRVIRHQNGAFYAFNQPASGSHFTPPAVALYGLRAWSLDYSVRPGFGGSVVPQQIWFPQGQGDRRRYVDQARFRMPIFFVNSNGSLGVPVLNAAEGRIQLPDVGFPAQLADKSTIKIRINWPGYANVPTSEQQVQLRDQTPQRNPFPFNRIVKHVASRVCHYLADCERVPVRPFNWFVGRGNITSDEVLLIGLVQVSEGSWMPILQLMSRIVMR